MQCIFNHPRVIAGKLHRKSKNAVELDDKLAAHWFFKAQVKSGAITVVAALPGADIESPDSKAPQGKRAKGPTPQSHE